VLPRPCLICGELTTVGSYCAAHGGRRGSTRAWRKTRARVLARDGYECQLCGGLASDVDHIRPVGMGGSDDPGNLRGLCANCHGQQHSGQV
jgi:5-methylcytosine-specific restriction enzyme A